MHVPNDLNNLQKMSGRNVVITGAAGGLGCAFSHTFASLGANLVLIDRPHSKLDDLRDSLKNFFKTKVDIVFCDLEFEEERMRLCSKIAATNEHLSCLVNNAAFVGSSDLSGWAEALEGQSIETWRRALEVNLTASFHLSQVLAPLLKKGINGNIVNITSIYGELGPDWSLYAGTGMGNPAAYGASKAGLDQLTRWLATTLAPDIRVNAICPGGILRDQKQQFIDRYVARTPLKRMARENDFCGAIAFLASDLGSYVTGQTIRVDGGWSAW